VFVPQIADDVAVAVGSTIQVRNPVVILALADTQG